MLASLRAGIPEGRANALGFACSAQFNFVFSRGWTFRDPLRGPALPGRVIRQLGAFNLIVLAGLVINSAAFKGVRALHVPIELAVPLAILASSAVVFLANYFGVFRRTPQLAAATGLPAAATGLPGIATGLPGVAHRTRDDGAGLATGPASPAADDAPPGDTLELSRDMAGIAFFLPAHNEAGNLRAAVEDIDATLSELGVPYRVIVVDDGSEDETPAVAAALATEYDAVDVVTHPENAGYGAALRSGFTAGYETGLPLIAFSDADRQFRGEDLRSLLTTMVVSDADLVVGYRAHRADSLRRRVMGAGWHWLSRRALGFGARDVDCGYKLIRRRALGDLLPHLDGEYATVSPQLLALAGRLGLRVAETPVRHYPREYGEQSGGSLDVAIRSLTGLIRLRLALDHLRLPGQSRRDRRSWWARIDPVVRLVAITATLLSIAAFLYFERQGGILSYKDAISHLLIARRVVDGPTPGMAQLGGVWLPLPHLLMVPLAGLNATYYTGLAGSLPSMVAYVLTGVLLYKFAWRLTGRRAAGLVASAVFLLNPNVLYMQSVPMTEIVLFAGMAGAVYGLLRWIQTNNYLYLVAASLAVLAATLTRYEGWVLLLLTAPVVFYTGIRRGLGRSQIEALLIAFLTTAAAGIVGWMVWNQLILGDWLGFQRGEYAKPSLWVGSGEQAVGHPDIAFLTYLYAMIDNLTPVIGVLALVALVVYVVRTRLRPESLPLLALLGFIPFFVYALYAGQRPLHVDEIHGTLYNVRFGLVVILPAALLIGYLAAEIPAILRDHPLRWAPAGALAVVAVLVAVFTVPFGRVITLQEPVKDRATAWAARAETASAFLRTRYGGGRVLMESFGNELVEFESRIPPDARIYEGSYRLWEPALENPRSHEITWIYMRRSEGTEDKVFEALHDTPQLAGYREVFADEDRLIYALPTAIRAT